MSYLVNVTERLVVNNTGNQSKELISAVKMYLNNIFSANGVETIDVREVRLTVDGNTQKVEDEEGGLNLEVSVSKEMTALMDQMQVAKEISLYANYTCMKYMGAEYGYGFFSKILMDGMQEFASYKCIETYDVEPEVIAFRFGIYDGVPENGFAPRTSDLSIVKHVESWYDNNFRFEIKIPEGTAIQEKLEVLLEEFADNCGGEFEDGELTKEGLCYEMDFTFVIDNAQVVNAINELNTIANLVKGVNGEFALQCSFEQDDAAGFCALWFLYEDGVVVAKAVNMNDN